MRIYYIDEPLTDDELLIVKESLDQRESPESVKLEQIRVPYVLPMLDRGGKSKPDEITAHIEQLKNNLVRSGILKDSGKQIAFVVPKQIYWGSVIQLAIEKITGFLPYAIQPWSDNGSAELVRENLRVIDVHGMTYGKD